MPTDSNDYWFPAKRYGWGWSLPSRWQGWVVLAMYAVLLVAGIVGLPPGRTQSGFALYVLGVTALLVLVEGGAAALALGWGLSGQVSRPMGLRGPYTNAPRMARTTGPGYRSCRCPGS